MAWPDADVDLFYYNMTIFVVADFVLPGVVRSLGGDGTVGEVDPGSLAELAGHALLVLTDTGLFLLEDDVDAWVRGGREVSFAVTDMGKRGWAREGGRGSVKAV